jgi:hypothetical protein
MIELEARISQSQIHNLQSIMERYFSLILQVSCDKRYKKKQRESPHFLFFKKEVMGIFD